MGSSKILDSLPIDYLLGIVLDIYLQQKHFKLH